MLVFFTTSRAELERRFSKLRRTMGPADGLWVAWPKKAAKIETDLDFETVQKIGLDAGLVDNKSAAIDDRWQALRFVIRVEGPLVATPRERAPSARRLCESDRDRRPGLCRGKGVSSWKKTTSTTGWRLGTSVVSQPSVSRAARRRRRAGRRR